MNRSARVFDGLAGALLAAVPGARAEAPPATIRFGVSNAGVGTPPRVATGWLAVAQARHALENEFEADGTRIDWVFFRGQGPAVNEALSNRQLDLTTLGDLPSVIGRAVGLPAKLVMVSSRGTNIYVVVQPARPSARWPICAASASATTRARPRSWPRRASCRSSAWPKRTKAVNMEPASSPAAFQSGDLDALIGGVSLLTWRDKGRARVVYARPASSTTAATIPPPPPAATSSSPTGSRRPTRRPPSAS